MVKILKYSLIGVAGVGLFFVANHTTQADSINKNDLVQVSSNAWCERNGYRLTNHRNWQGYVTDVTSVPRTSYSDKVYRIVYKNGEHNDYVLAQDVKLIDPSNSKYSVGSEIKLSDGAWAENNGYSLVNHQGWTGTIVSKRAIVYNSHSQYEYYIKYANGSRNEHVLEQDISVSQPKYSVGQTVKIANNAWAESNGYNLVNHQNWIGTVTARRAIGKSSNSGYSYTIQYPDGEHNDYVLEQDLSTSTVQPKYANGDTVKVSSNAWCESNGYNLVNHRNWVGTVIARREVQSSYSHYVYTVKYKNGEQNDYILEQDLEKSNEQIVSNPSVSASDIGSQVNGTTPNVDVMVYNIKTGATTHYTKGAIDLNYTASMVKVAILTELLHEQPNLSSSQKALAVKMITKSDNDAATSLSSQIGKDAGMQRLFNNLGMSNSYISGTNQWGLTSTNATDYMKLMKQIFISGNYISESNRQYIQSLMSSVDSGQRWGLPAKTASGTSLYVKDGWLPLGNNYTNAIVNSVSRVKNSKSDYIVVQMSNEDNTQNDGFDMLNRIGQKIYDKLNS